jgi:hypothetical protein
MRNIDKGDMVLLIQTLKARKQRAVALLRDLVNLAEMDMRPSDEAMRDVRSFLREEGQR